MSHSCYPTEDAFTESVGNLTRGTVVSDYHTIREVRFDITDYVIHLTRRMVHIHHGTGHNLPFYQEGLDRLKDIVNDGYLVPTQAPAVTCRNVRTHVIKGHPAVCFSEMPLDAIITTLQHVDCTSHVGYGVALHKVDLHNYGGRPVLYGDYALFRALPADLQYLFMRYDPRKRGQPGNPYDFTFEREWRSRVTTYPLAWGHKLKGVPLLLPDNFTNIADKSTAGKWQYSKRPPDVRLIVALNQDVALSRQSLRRWKPKATAGSYFQIYYCAIQKAQIISLEYVKEQIDNGDQDYRKIDTLPSPKDMPDLAPLVED